MMRAYPKIWVLLILLAILSGLAPASSQGDPGFGGVGLQVVPITTGELVVIGVLSGSPAAQAGIQPGDYIYAVDQRELKGTEFAEVVSKYLWGVPGSEVTLSFLRPGVAGEKKITLRRVPVKDRESPPIRPENGF